MIDNRPKVHHRKRIQRIEEITEQPEQRAYEPPQAAASPSVPVDAPVRTKAVHTAPMAGLGGLGGLLGNLGGSLGGIGGILPLVLVVSALNRGRAPAHTPTAGPPFQSQGLPAVPATAPEPPPGPKAEAHTGRKTRRELRSMPAPQEPAVQSAPIVEAPDPPPRPPRPAPKPADVRNLLGDLAGYLPGTGGASASRISRIIGIADELKSLGSDDGVYAAAATEDPLNRHIGLLNALGRNLPVNGASNLNRASQVLTLVNTLRGGGQNLGGMAGMLRSAMAQPQSAAPEMKNITPQQADGIKDTVNRLLSGMDDKQKSELLDKAKDFLGKK